MTPAGEWNNRYPVGTVVRYWPGAREGEGRKSVTRTRAWTLHSGDPVVSVEGYTGGVALTHVEPDAPPATRDDDLRAQMWDAISRVLREHECVVPLSTRGEVADAVLAVRDEELETVRATAKFRAEAKLAKARELAEHGEMRDGLHSVSVADLDASTPLLSDLRNALRRRLTDQGPWWTE